MAPGLLRLPLLLQLLQLVWAAAAVSLTVSRVAHRMLQVHSRRMLITTAAATATLKATGRVCGRQGQAGIAAAQRMTTAASAVACDYDDSGLPTAPLEAAALQVATAFLESLSALHCLAQAAPQLQALLRLQSSPAPSAPAALAISPHLPLGRLHTALLATTRKAATERRRCGTAHTLARPVHPRLSPRLLAAAIRMGTRAAVPAAQVLVLAQWQRLCQQRSVLPHRLALLPCPRPLQRTRLQ